MLLAIDCGNTNTVFSIWDGARFLATWRIATDHKRTADEYFVWLSSLMLLTKTEAKVTEAIISSTVPRVVFNLRVLCDRYFNCRPLVVGKPDCRLPVAPRVDQGTTVGPDRLVNTVAGFDRHGGDLIVVDFGTATTFDVVDLDGAYVGGVIAPGVNLSLEALHMAAAALPHVDVAKPERPSARIRWPACSRACILGLCRPVEGIVREDPPRTRPPDESDRDRGPCIAVRAGNRAISTHRGRSDHARPRPDQRLQQGDPMSANRLIYLPLGGAGEIGMNCLCLWLWGRRGKERLILVDLGVTFPDMDTSPGVDLILPDIGWLPTTATARSDLHHPRA
jgi:type III pantothenate kinase